MNQKVDYLVKFSLSYHANLFFHVRAISELLNGPDENINASVTGGNSA